MLKFVWVIYMSKNEKPHNRIAELRKEKGLTLQQVADAIGVGNNTISRYETGKREPKLETWSKLADFFDVPVSYLQGISDIKDDIDKWRVEDLKRSGQMAIWLEKDTDKLLKNYSSVSAKSLTYHQLETVTTLTERFNSLVGSLAEYNSYKTLKALKNVIATLGIITAQYRLLSDDPELFEKRVIPVVNEFLFELKKLE